MSDIFAEATVRISPSLTGFKTQLEKDLKEIMAKVKVQPIRVRPALTRDFVGDLRRQVNAAILQAQRGVKPVVIRTVLDVPSQRALRELRIAPVGPAAGHVPPTAGPTGGVSAQDQETINRLLKGNVQLLGLQEVATDKVTESTKRRTDATKKGLSASERNTKADKLAAEAMKTLEGRHVKAIQGTTELAQKKRELAEADKAVTLAEKAAAAQGEGRRSVAEALRETRQTRARLLAEAEQLQQGATTAPAVRAAAGLTAAQKAAITTSRKSVDATRLVVAGLRETDEVSKTLGATTKDLTAREELLRKQKLLLKDATKAVTLAQATENQVARTAALQAQKNAQSQINANQAQITSINQLKEQERLRAKIISDQARANARNTASEKRRSEQLSRGGQASLLSLAGIRGATLAASRSFLVGAAAITVFARAVKQFADLERNIHVFAATTSATAEQMRAVREEARQLGADLTLPSVTAGDAAGAMVELAKAGLTVQDSIDGARAVLELATAAAIENAEAVRLTANVLNAFSLSGRDAAEVADTLANAANAAQGSIADIGTAFQQAATAGHQVGLSFQDTATFLTILAKNGIRGSDAGTSLRTALIRLVNPSKAAKEQFQQLGIALRDAQGNLRPDVFLQIAAATERLGPAQRDATIALIGGQDAFRAVTILGRQSAKSFLEMRAALRQEGTAAELAKARTEGLHGAIDGLQSVLETVGTTAAGHVGPALSEMVRHLSSGITALSQNEQLAEALNQTLTTSSQVFATLGDAIRGVASIALPLAGALANVVNAIGVSTILAGVVAYKALNAALDGTILRARILQPLLKIIATARVSAAVGEIAKVGTQMTLPFTAAERASLGLTPKLSALRLGLKGIGAAAVAAATSLTGVTIGVAALAAGIAFLVLRESAGERAARRLREETEKLAGAFERADAAASGLQSAERGAQRGLTGLQQARLNLVSAQTALAQSGAAPGSSERTQLTLNLKVATQDLTFATEDYEKALKDLKVAQGEDIAAQLVENRERGKARQALDELIKRTQIQARARRLGAGGRFGGIDVETVAREKLIATLRKQSAAELLSESATTQAIGLRKRLVELIVRQTEIPLDKLAPNLEKIFSAQNLDAALRRAAVLFGVRGKEAVDAFIKAVSDGFLQHGNLGLAIENALTGAAVQATSAAEEAGGVHASAYEHGFGQAMTDIVAPNIAAVMKATLSGATELALLELKGASLQAQLVQARETARIARGVRERAERGFREHPGVPSREATLDRAIAAEQAANADVERIIGEISAADKDTASKIEDAAKERDTKGQKIVDALLQGRRATLLQRKITTAGLSEWLGDDLKTNQAWLNYLRDIKATLLKRLKAVGASKEVIQQAMTAISDLIFETTNTIKKINADIQDNIEERQKALRDIIFQKIDLRIRIAQAREDVAAEIKLRRQRLAILTRELRKLEREGKKNTIAWLELKAQQQEEIAAIKDLKKQVDDRNNAFAELSFSFLTTQQGFAANLLGNLLPGGAVGGTVGGGGPTVTGARPGPSPLPAGIGAGALATPRTAFEHGRGIGGADARAAITKAGEAGPTRGQATVELDLLRQILRVLRSIEGGRKFKEARQAASTSGAAMDTY